jgi:hypothetical protein
MSFPFFLLRKPIAWARALLALLAFAPGLSPAASAPDLPWFDFAREGTAQGWSATHDVPACERTADGLRIAIDGPDPYVHGPARDFPAGTPLWLKLRLRSEAGGGGQVFFFRDRPSEADSVRFDVPAGLWSEVTLRLPPLGPDYRLRLDPPGDRGECVVAWIRFEERVSWAAPVWPRPGAPELGTNAATLRSGLLELAHGRHGLGAFELKVDGHRMASGLGAALLGYVAHGQARWVPFGRGSRAVVNAWSQPQTPLGDTWVGGKLSVRALFPDDDRGRWEVEQTFAPGPDGTIECQITVRADVDRDILHLPLLALLPGLGTFGTNKSQALLAGVEYLENEPSSSAADLAIPASDRQVPAAHKLTFPLMAVAADDRYVGLLWNREQDTNISAFFDSPDRLFGSEAHVMGLLFPGSDGANRDERSLVPFAPVRLPAGRAVRLGAMIVGGRGRTVVPAVRQFVRLQGLPAVPRPPYSAVEYFRLAARGWLDSKAREGDRYRHAYWPGFAPGPAADAAWQMQWLAAKVQDEPLARRLEAAAVGAIAQVPAGQENEHQVGHVASFVPALLAPDPLKNAERARAKARVMLGRFEGDGLVRYRPVRGGPDYGRTHWAADASGLAAPVVATLLESAALSGDRTLIVAGLRHLRGLTGRYRDTVPRGAQTWEIPLHTPDVLAAAHMVRACVLGYELDGDAAWLDHARDWAWTGVPFVYLTPPTPGEVGVYSTIAVLGATGWQAPVWLGQPVQWCGLVYAAALQRLARHDPEGPWNRIASGIAAAGLQHTWPATDANRGGLLPDFFLLAPQRRDGPAINPATAFLPALGLLGEPLPCVSVVLRRQGWIVHAPGPLEDLVETTDRVAFRVRAWPRRSYGLLVAGLDKAPRVRIDGEPAPIVAPHRFDDAVGGLVLRLEGAPAIELTVDR